MTEVLEQLWQHASDFSQALEEVSVTNLTNGPMYNAQANTMAELLDNHLLAVSKKLKEVKKAKPKKRKSKSMQGANKRAKENHEPVSAKIESGSAIFLEELATTGPSWKLTIEDFLEHMMLLNTGSKTKAEEFRKLPLISEAM
ncbi:hypothetical protein FRC12_025231 [Ceratobasidium sp. 428]|nr:hypothetical protein FRC12_025231 [Ceratobasidium sp. 428]